jgi:hypothetical protein
MCMLRLLGISVLFLLLHQPAAADWTEAGAQFRCDAPTQTFEILPYPRYNGEDGPVKQGFKAFPDGMSTHACTLDRYRLVAQVNVLVPPLQGACVGPGLVKIPSLSVDGVELLEHELIFDLDCPSANLPDIVDLKIRPAATGVDFTLCHATLTSEPDPGEVVCDTRTIDIAPKPTE